MDLKYSELKKEYDDFERAILSVSPNTDSQQILHYYMAAILDIWGSNLLYSPDYTILLNEISGEHYTIEQTVTAMECCGDTERHMAVPDFFKALVRHDLGTEKEETAEFIERLNDLLVASATINGDFTVKEAKCLSGILSDLSEYARSQGVLLSETPDNTGKITEKKLDTYLQNDELVEAARKNARTGAVPSDKSDSESSASINITINSINMSGSTAPTNDAAEYSDTADDETPAISKPDGSETETMESLLAELDGLVGLESVKRDVHSLMNFIKVTTIREKRGMKVPTISYHLVFTGNPGTGKTTVARLVAKLYYHMGILPQGQLVETDRSALVAGYLGQTAIKTQKVIQQAMGGVLFIDEAYSLAGDEQDSYGKEAIETILKAMEDHRDELVVIVAGYTDLMHKFIESNPGLSSRFSKYFEFPDYNGEELIDIFERFCRKNGYVLDKEAAELLKSNFDSLYDARDQHFGNARTARNIFEKAINAQADRIASQNLFSDSDLENITAEDISIALGGIR